MRVRAGGQTFTILRAWDKGFALDSDDATQLRGLVDLYDGATHLSRCLIVASNEDDGETVYEYKRATPVADRAALDYSKDEDGAGRLIGTGLRLFAGRQRPPATGAPPRRSAPPWVPILNPHVPFATRPEARVRGSRRCARARISGFRSRADPCRCR